jgi:hypothetical protein
MTNTTDPKSATVTLRANGHLLRLIALRKGDKAVSYVAMIDGATKKMQRGMTEQHPNFDAAKAAIAALAEKAVKQGWNRPAPGRAFSARPDAFNSLPAAPKAVKGGK